MEFTYAEYRGLLSLLRQYGYEITNYHNWEKKKHSVILRHDVDNSIEAALKLARQEYECNVKSTYLILVSSDFYNVFSLKSTRMIREIQKMGHEIGLHFDEMAYPDAVGNVDRIREKILCEIELLRAVAQKDVTVVSMHRPSKVILESNLQIPNVINTYSSVFFKRFKYLSDSRRCWREPVTDIIQGKQYDHLQILIHAFWYHNMEKGLQETVSAFISDGCQMRYQTMKENIRDLDSILKNEM